MSTFTLSSGGYALGSNGYSFTASDSYGSDAEPDDPPAGFTGPVAPKPTGQLHLDASERIALDSGGWATFSGPAFSLDGIGAATSGPANFRQYEDVFTRFIRLDVNTGFGASGMVRLEVTNVATGNVQFVDFSQAGPDQAPASPLPFIDTGRRGVYRARFICVSGNVAVDGITLYR